MIDFLLGVPGKLKTIYDYLTTHLSSTRAAKIDQLDAAISTRAPASTALSSAMWTATKAGYLDAAISSVARIKSIQHVTGSGSFTTATSQTFTATITAVNTSKAFFLVNGVSFGSYPWVMNAVFSSTTQISGTVGRTDIASSRPDVNLTVIEFY